RPRRRARRPPEPALRAAHARAVVPPVDRPARGERAPGPGRGGPGDRLRRAPPCRPRPLSSAPAWEGRTSVFAAVRGGWGSFPMLHREGPDFCSGGGRAYPGRGPLVLNGENSEILAPGARGRGAGPPPFA